MVPDFPGSPVVKSPPTKAGAAGSIPGPGRTQMLQDNEAQQPQPLRPCAPRASALQQGKPQGQHNRAPQLESRPLQPQLE